ncbi:dynamin family protein [Arcobacter porcinus]|uniref:GTP-binding protein (Dynamin domain) n=1 Tax=Arcobacter porcinus TaxID=1935204 RepID=A0A5C2HA51_9BACT|nr:dynamin family protein [Arcobacter porcinus]OCL97197.1 Bacterial dynamin-like protein [Aliarcobacter thereius]QEP39803.1 GTP-binding protein (dynamin domain) [Arcobacter porcinus]
MQNNLTKPEIKNKIDNLEKYFSKYKNGTSSKKLEDVKQNLDKQEYKIAVVANMSSGKSTFINALFGKEVLPAYNHATTDSATYIYSKPNIKKKAEIFFSDGRKNITITEDLEKEIKQYAQKDEDCKDNKYKNVEKIDLYYPFLNLQTSSNEDFSITFIDTPGPNSTGDGYKQKHKDQTRSVLNSVDMALFVFDYGQLDANLSSDEQGLWHTIKTRYEKDKNFEVYFLINKIDMSMNDNFKDLDNSDRENFIKQKKENWFKHEKIAIDKIVDAAKKHGIDNPKVYPISSYYQLLERNDKKGYDDEDFLDLFKKQHFKRVFENNWEEEFIKYLGILNLEDNINNYINTEVKNKILKIALDNILTIKNDEISSLQTNIQTLSKPKEEATANVEKALNFLNKEAIELEKDMNNKFKISSEKAIEEINDLIDTAIKDELTSKIDEMSKKAIAYAEEIAYGREPKIAQKSAKNKYHSISLLNDIQIELENHIDTDFVFKAMQDYIKSILEDYKNNYLDVKTVLRKRFREYEEDISKIFRKVKDRLNSELQDALDIDIQNIEMQTVDIDSTLSFDISIPNSVLDYKYQEAEYETFSDSDWYKPWTWGNTIEVLVQEEEHLFTINPKDLKKSIEDSMKESIKQFYSKEKNNYKKTINSLKDINFKIFEEFKSNKQEEISKLQDDIKNSEKELVVVEKQLEDFNNLTKE